MLTLKFVQGFWHQKGAIFGFGEKVNDDTGSVLKLSTLNEDEVEKMNEVQVHNIGEERSVRFFNYEIGIRDKKMLRQCQGKWS